MVWNRQEIISAAPSHRIVTTFIEVLRLLLERDASSS